MRLFYSIVLSLAVPQVASAVMIVGSIGFSSAPGASFNPVNGATGAITTLSTATGVGFIAGPTGDGVVTSASGDLVAAAGGTADFMDFSFAGPGSASFPTVPTNLWTTSLGTFALSMSSVSIIAQTSQVLALEGTGILTSTIAGLDPTAGVWALTLNQSGQSFSFSSSATVPEPISAISWLVLFSGAAAFVVVRRRSLRTAG